MAAQPAAGLAPNGYGSPTYRAYVLGALLVLYTFNFIDRIVLGIVQEPIKREFGLQDWQLGLLGGPAFALLYTLLGIPIARLAERRSRINIIAFCAGFWSLMTAACGLTTNFWQILAARIGVSIGEAGCTPPSLSLISDYFPPERRTSAMSIYALGIPIGSALAGIGGGWLAQTFSWRAAFLVLGLPGLLMAILAKFTIKEAPRVGQQAAPPFGAALTALLRKRAFLHVAFGGALVSFYGYSSSQFLPSYLIRNFELSLLQASLVFAGLSASFVVLGTFLGGVLVDHWRPRHPRILSFLPATSLVLAVPLYLSTYAAPSLLIALVPLCLGAAMHYLYLGPMYAVALGVAPPRVRATATAVLLFIVNLIGYGLGPPALGLVSDAFSHNFGPALGLRYALMIDTLVLLWAALHFFLASRTLKRDLEPA